MEFLSEIWSEILLFAVDIVLCFRFLLVGEVGGTLSFSLLFVVSLLSSVSLFIVVELSLVLSVSVSVSLSLGSGLLCSLMITGKACSILSATKHPATLFLEVMYKKICTILKFAFATAYIPFDLRQLSRP